MARSRGGILDTVEPVHVKHVLHVDSVGEPKMPPPGKQNLTVSLDAKTVQKAKVLAARRSTSISGLVAAHIEALVDEDEAYERAHRAALNLMQRGFHMGGTHSIHREEIHER